MIFRTGITSSSGVIETDVHMLVERIQHKYTMDGNEEERGSKTKCNCDGSTRNRVSALSFALRKTVYTGGVSRMVYLIDV